MIIVDMGSGNTCLNDLDYVKRMITELAQIDPHKQDVVIKWQLFDSWGKNVPLTRAVFAKAYEIAWGFGYETTASVFDLPSLDFLLKFEVPFIKIANNPDVQYLAQRIPDDIRVIRSVGDSDSFGSDCLCCVSKYPAKKEHYLKAFKPAQLRSGISDHTTNWDLYKEFEPENYEVHYRLPESTGLDAGPFSRTPEDLKEIL